MKELSEFSEDSQGSSTVTNAEPKKAVSSITGSQGNSLNGNSYFNTPMVQEKLENTNDYHLDIDDSYWNGSNKKIVKASSISRTETDSSGVNLEQQQSSSG